MKLKLSASYYQMDTNPEASQMYSIISGRRKKNNEKLHKITKKHKLNLCFFILLA
jgi:hypothetical protein